MSNRDAMTTPHHSWSQRYPVDEHHTFRRCWNCELIKITRHESEGAREMHWIEWRRNGERIESERTPACVAVAAEVAA